MPPAPGRSTFSREDDEHLAAYIAHVKPAPAGRAGNAIYQALVEQGKKYPWASNHSWQSWRHRYVKNQPKFDYRITKIQQEMAARAAQFFADARKKGKEKAGQAVAQPTEKKPELLTSGAKVGHRLAQPLASTSSLLEASKRPEKFKTSPPQRKPISPMKPSESRPQPSAPKPASPLKNPRLTHVVPPTTPRSSSSSPLPELELSDFDYEGPVPSTTLVDDDMQDLFGEYQSQAIQPQSRQVHTATPAKQPGTSQETLGSQPVVLVPNSSQEGDGNIVYVLPELRTRHHPLPSASQNLSQLEARRKAAPPAAPLPPQTLSKPSATSTNPSEPPLAVAGPSKPRPRPIPTKRKPQADSDFFASSSSESSGHSTPSPSPPPPPVRRQLPTTTTTTTTTTDEGNLRNHDAVIKATVSRGDAVVRPNILKRMRAYIESEESENENEEMMQGPIRTLWPPAPEEEEEEAENESPPSQPALKIGRPPKRRRLEQGMAVTTNTTDPAPAAAPAAVESAPSVPQATPLRQEASLHIQSSHGSATRKSPVPPKAKEVPKPTRESATSQAQPIPKPISKSTIPPSLPSPSHQRAERVADVFDDVNDDADANGPQTARTSRSSVAGPSRHVMPTVTVDLRRLSLDRRARRSVARSTSSRASNAGGASTNQMDDRARLLTRSSTSRSPPLDNLPSTSTHISDRHSSIHVRDRRSSATSTTNNPNTHIPPKLIPARQSNARSSIVSRRRRSERSSSMTTTTSSSGTHNLTREQEKIMMVGFQAIGAEFGFPAETVRGFYDVTGDIEKTMELLALAGKGANKALRRAAFQNEGDQEDEDWEDEGRDGGQAMVVDDDDDAEQDRNQEMNSSRRVSGNRHRFQPAISNHRRVSNSSSVASSHHHVHPKPTTSASTNPHPEAHPSTTSPRLSLSPTKLSNPRRRRSSRHSLTFRIPSPETLALLDSQEQYSPPDKSRAGQFARLVREGRMDEAIEREKKRAAGVTTSGVGKKMEGLIVFKSRDSGSGHDGQGGDDRFAEAHDSEREEDEEDVDSDGEDDQGDRGGHDELGRVEDSENEDEDEDGDEDEEQDEDKDEGEVDEIARVSPSWKSWSDRDDEAQNSSSEDKENRRPQRRDMQIDEDDDDDDMYVDERPAGDTNRIDNDDDGDADTESTSGGEDDVSHKGRHLAHSVDKVASHKVPPTTTITTTTTTSGRSSDRNVAKTSNRVSAAQIKLCFERISKNERPWNEDDEPALIAVAHRYQELVDQMLHPAEDMGGEQKMYGDPNRCFSSEGQDLKRAFEAEVQPEVLRILTLGWMFDQAHRQ